MLVSPRAAQWQPEGQWIALTLDSQATLFYLLKGLMLTAAFFLVLALVNSAGRVKLLLQVLVLAGTLQALYGSLMVLSGLELGFFVEKYASRGSASGTFVNRNHLAGFLVMCLSAGTGLLLSQLARSGAGSLRESLRRALALLLSPKIRLRIYLAIMVIGLVLTRSRMGNISFFIGLSVAGVAALASGRHFSWRIALFLASLFIVDVMILGKWFGFEKLALRLQETDIASEQRLWSNEYTVDMVAEFPLTGSGGGSFYGVFPNYQTAVLEGYHAHAHNDYLEFAADLGIPAALMAASFFLLCVWHGWRVQCTRHSALFRGVGFAVIMTCSWAALHSMTDFNLQIPANALLFVTLLALAPICRAIPGKSV